MPAKDPTTGKFVAKKSAREIELEEQIADLRARVPEEAELAEAMASVELDGETQVVEAPKRESLVLQSKYNEHTVSIVPTRRVFHPVTGMIEPVPGLFAQFKGPQRIFDSLIEQEKWGWTDEQLDAIEQKLVGRSEFMKDYYPAPLRPLPEHLKQYARVKEEPKVRYCMAFGYVEGRLTQCDQLATAGRDWCHEHDPSTVKITTGGGTTVR